MSNAFMKHLVIALTLLVMTQTASLLAESSTPDDDTPYSSDIDTTPPADANEPGKKPAPAKGADQKGYEKPKPRKYFVPDPQRTDAGIFHVAFAGGGNFYIEPQLNASTRVATGNYFKDFGFQAGVYFDYDYSQLTENVPLGIRGFVGYKYILSSVHAFSFDALARYMLRVSEHTMFGAGIGGSASMWYRVSSSTSSEEILFLPAFVLGAGFEFNPFMVDFKWLINRIGQNATIMGWELYFGVRL